MTIIKKKITTFYIQLMVICLISFLGSCPFFYKIYRVFHENETTEGLYILITAGLFMIGYGFYMIYLFYKKVPSIVIKDKLLQIGNEVFELKQIVNYDNSSKAKFFSLNKSGSEMPILRIELQDKNIMLYKEMYSNINELERVLSEYFYQSQK